MQPSHLIDNYVVNTLSLLIIRRLRLVSERTSYSKMIQKSMVMGSPIPIDWHLEMTHITNDDVGRHTSVMMTSQKAHFTENTCN